MATWGHTNITIDGQLVKAQAPVIVSASRSTDIPAFYADWFFDRLEKGYSAWTNPFNGIKSYISYDKTRFIVFWSKNPSRLLKYLHILKERNIKCYIQYTLNDYEKERLENVPPLSQRIETFKQLVDNLGIGAVIWRFDPMILTDDISIDNLLDKVRNIGDQLKGYTDKLVFSYADITMYRKVRHNLEVNGIPYHEWEIEQMDEFADKLSTINRELGWNFQLATCGEKIDISKYGIQHNRCIDGDLITRLAWDDKELMDFMKVKIEDISITAFLHVIILFAVHGYNALQASGKYSFACLITLTCLTDIGAYLIGRHFGKHKLIERLSPKKTVEGSVGGFAFGVLGGILAFYFFTEVKPLTYILLAVLGALNAQIGDLFFSAIKRHYGIKDYGHYLKGHGGMLDRMDSILFNMLLAYIVFLFTGLLK